MLFFRRLNVNFGAKLISLDHFLFFFIFCCFLFSFKGLIFVLSDNIFFLVNPPEILVPFFIDLAFWYLSCRLLHPKVNSDLQAGW